MKIGCYTSLALFVVILAVMYAFLDMNVDILTDFTSENEIGIWGMQTGLLGFCLQTSFVEKLLSLHEDNPTRDGASDGANNVGEDNYSKQSIYSILYSSYSLVGTTKSDKDIPYEFTFNTWGVAPRDTEHFPEDAPQRMGQEAYRRLTDFEPVKAQIREKNKVGPVKFLELGCGTGAGANLTSHIHTNSHYTALDMQKKAVNTCNRLHAHDALPGVRGKLECIQGNAQNVPLPDNSVDIVIISETHIAEYDELTEEDLKILAEIERVLVPNGHFVWGNAICATAWDQIEQYFGDSQKWEVAVINDVTDEAIKARDLDVDRVESYVNDLLDLAPFVKPFFPSCGKLIRELVVDFYRHPGTRLYEVMETRYHLYKQDCFRLK